VVGPHPAPEGRLRSSPDAQLPGNTKQDRPVNSDHSLRRPWQRPFGKILSSNVGREVAQALNRPFSFSRELRSISSTSQEGVRLKCGARMISARLVYWTIQRSRERESSRTGGWGRVGFRVEGGNDPFQQRLTALYNRSVFVQPQMQPCLAILPSSLHNN